MCYKGKGNALECSSYRGIKLLEHVLKVLERVVEARLRKTVKIDDMQFGFCPGKGTTDAIFIVRQVQEKFLGKQKELWMAFVDLEKAFDRVPHEVLWWALRHVGVEEWMVNVIKSMYDGVTTAVKRNGEESENFEVKVGVHQGSVLSPILFDIVMQAIADNFKKGLPWELLYADDLVLMAESRLELEERLTECMYVCMYIALVSAHHVVDAEPKFSCQIRGAELTNQRRGAAKSEARVDGKIEGEVTSGEHRQDKGNELQ